jgi:kinesin family protein 11
MNGKKLTSQLHTSYSSLGRDFKTLFEDLLKHVSAQKAEAEALRQQLSAASELAMQSNTAASSRLDEVLRDEREQAAADRQTLVSQITSLIMAQGEQQEKRLEGKISEVQKDVITVREIFEESHVQYGKGMDAWNEKEVTLVEEVLRSRETLKSKLKEDWVVSTRLNSSKRFTDKFRLLISITHLSNRLLSPFMRRQYALWTNKSRILRLKCVLSMTL